MEKIYKIYEHICPNGKVYIGITQQNVEKRWKKGKGYNTQKLFYRAIQKYGWDNIKHIVLFENLTKEEAEKKEIELIKLFQSNNRLYGYNIENGGMHRGKTSEETRRKISMGNKGKPPNSGCFKKGHKSYLTEESKQKISETSKGRPATSGSFKKGHVGYMKGVKMPLEVRKKISEKSGKKVLQFNIAGKYINEYKSCIEAAQKTGLKNGCHIGSCCNGKRKTAGGYIWKFKEE